MFGNGDKTKPARNGSVETLIGPRVVIRGDVHFSGGLYVEGTIQGAVIAEEGCADAVVTLADKGVIEGEVRAPHVIVNGQLRGDVYATGHIELAANARVQGNIYYQVVQMAAGATLTGRLIHGEPMPPKQLPKPEVMKQLEEVAA
jgi:cytoskeletal protein CcmA (bactofilin family)